MVQNTFSDGYASAARLNRHYTGPSILFTPIWSGKLKIRNSQNNMKGSKLHAKEFLNNSLGFSEIASDFHSFLGVPRNPQWFPEIPKNSQELYSTKSNA